MVDPTAGAGGDGALSNLRALASLVLPTGPLSTARFDDGGGAGSGSGNSSYHGGGSGPPLFALDSPIDAASVFFCRSVLVDRDFAAFFDGENNDDDDDENDDDGGGRRRRKNRSSFGQRTERAFRFISASILAYMSYRRMPYDWICATHLYSHVAPRVLVAFLRSKRAMANGRTAGQTKMNGAAAKTGKHGVGVIAPPRQVPSSSLSSAGMSLLMSLVLLVGGPASLYLCRLFSDLAFLAQLCALVPAPIRDAVDYMFPVREMAASYRTVSSFVVEGGGERLRRMLKHLLFVTFHSQVGLGYLGIDFLTAEQKRRNMLIRMDLEKPPGDDDDNDQNGVGPQEGREEKKTSNGRAVAETKKTITANSNDSFDKSRKFRRSAAPFIIFAAFPYMLKIILFGNLNNFAFMYVRNEIHRSVRIEELFNHDSHLTAVASDSTSSPDVYASAMDTVVSTAYDVFNRKFFSLPKLVLLPGVVSRQPMLLLKIFPFIIFTDVVKGRIVASVTDRLEQLDKEARDINTVRQKVESFDLKNAELLRRSGVGATAFTRRRWDELTQQYQDKVAASDLLKRTRGYYRWLQRNFVFVALIDCALAKLLADGGIAVSEIFVFSRAIEDAVDLLLMRSRSESELATLMVQIDKLKVLDEMWSKSKEENLVPCRIVESGTAGGEKGGGIVLNNLQYSRGTASISIDRLDIEPGIYAVTGANGSGKSTMFRLLMACDTNDRPIDLHTSIVLGTPKQRWDLSGQPVLPEGSCNALDEGCEVAGDLEEEEEKIPVTSIVMPSPDVVEISQTFYWPLHTKPVDWIYQRHVTTDCDDDAEREGLVRRVAEELMSLSFAQALENDTVEAANATAEEGAAPNRDGQYKDRNGRRENDAAVSKLAEELQEEKEDWFGELSGGQKSKVELVRKVFLHDECPSVLLVDETMAPLDPASKSQIMSKIKSFCVDSVVLVIYHTDVGRGVQDEDGRVGEECVPGNDFFEKNLHVDNGHLVHRPVC